MPRPLVIFNLLFRRSYIFYKPDRPLRKPPSRLAPTKCTTKNTTGLLPKTTKTTNATHYVPSSRSGAATYPPSSMGAAAYRRVSQLGPVWTHRVSHMRRCKEKPSRQATPTPSLPSTPSITNQSQSREGRFGTTHMKVSIYLPAPHSDRHNARAGSTISFTREPLKGSQSKKHATFWYARPPPLYSFPASRYALVWRGKRKETLPPPLPPLSLREQPPPLPPDN